MFYRHAPAGRVSILARYNRAAGMKQVTFATEREALLDDLMNSRKAFVVRELVHLIQHKKYFSRSDSVYGV